MKIAKQAIILGIVFMVALIGYFTLSLRSADKEITDKTKVASLQEVLPLLFVKSFDKEMNILYPYISEQTDRIDYDSLNILSSDRTLSLRQDKEIGIVSVSYEINSATELIDEQKIEHPQIEDNILTIKLNNILIKNREYHLKLIFDTREYGKIFYYTRIMMTDDENIRSIVELADTFSLNNLDYDKARENTIYLESDETGDNSSLGFVNLKSNFNQLVYNNLKLEILGNRDIRLLYYDGRSAEVSIAFDVVEEGDTIKIYEITENFTMRIGEERIYMLDYTRTMNEVFMGDASGFGNGRIVFGIQESAPQEWEENENYLTFVVNRELFLVDKKNAQVKKVFSFRNGSSPRRTYRNHNIKLLSVDDAGNVKFLLYGYMNAGNHEADSGIAYMQYGISNDTIAEKMYISVDLAYESLHAYLSQLSFQSEENLYLKIADRIYSIDIKTGSYNILAENLREEDYAVNTEDGMLAWKGSENSLYLMNLSTGTRKQLDTQGRMEPVGFLGKDLVVAYGDSNAEWIENGRKMDAVFSEVRILSENMEVKSEYKKDIYLYDIHVQNERVHLQMIRKEGENTYRYAGEDTIVSNLSQESKGNLGYYASVDRGRIYYLKADFIQPENITLRTPTEMAVDNLHITLDVRRAYDPYLAYKGRRLLGIYERADQAIEVSYLQYGRVVYDKGIVYKRGSIASYKGLKAPDASVAEYYIQARQNNTISDLRGITLRQALYFIADEQYVLAYTRANNPVLLYGYDRSTVSVYDIISGSIYKIGIAEAEKNFMNTYNDFSSFFTFE